MKCKLKKGDKVIVIAGKDKGKTGLISSVMPKEGKVLVEGINLATKHSKPRNSSEPGSIIKKEMPLHISNVSHIDPVSGAPTKAGYKFVDGQKVRYAKKSGQNI